MMERRIGRIVVRVAPAAAWLLLALWLALPQASLGCTSAIVARETAEYHRTLLWKHRDSGHPDNFVDRVEGTDSTLAYVALFNAGDTARAEAWAGFNAAGFAVMNTASYNLAPDTAAVKDREGVLMTEALRRCRTVADFRRMLGELTARGPIGVQANFGVTDANGDGAYFETTDHTFREYPLAESAEGVLVRSNYSYSGGEEGKLGTVRHDDAVALLEAPVKERAVRAETFTEELSRSFYHAGEGRDMASGNRRWLTDRGEYIPRRSSCASVVIEGALPGEDASRGTVMWVAIGFPAASHVVAVTLDSVPAELRPDAVTGRSPLCDEVNRHRQKVFPRRGREGKWLIDLDYLRKIEPGLREQSAAAYDAARQPGEPLTINR